MANLSSRATTIEHVVSAGDMSANVTSDVVDVRYRRYGAVQLVFSGTPTGTFTIEASVDGVNFNALDFGAAIEAAGAAGSHLIELADIGYDKLRVVYTRTSGTGTLEAYVMCKGA